MVNKLLKLFGNAFRSHWKVALSTSLLLVAAYDTWIDELTVIAATFIGLAALPWIMDLFDKVTLPGGIELNLAKARQVLDQRNVEASPETAKQFQFLPDDPNFALVALRIEIEKKLRLMYSRDLDEKSSRYLNIYRIIEELSAQGRIDQEIASAVRDMLPSMNKAAHGEEVPETARSWVQQNGPRLLAALDRIASQTGN